MEKRALKKLCQQRINLLMSFLLSLIACLLIYKMLLSFGIVRAIPKDWVTYCNNYHLDSTENTIPSKAIKCPLCNGRVVSLYYGLADHHRKECDSNGNRIWEFRGCINDGTYWQCKKCGKRFGHDGKAFYLLSKLKESDKFGIEPNISQ